MTPTEKKLLDLLEKVLNASDLTTTCEGYPVRFAPDALWDEISETLAENGR